ncbi:MAG: YqjK family protein [Betaproteobacteria bacterium]
MNHQRALELATRRGELTILIAAQREALANNLQPVATVLNVGDRARDGVDWLKNHPALVAVAAAAVVIAKPRGVWRWAKRGFVLFRGWKALRAKLAR